MSITHFPGQEISRGIMSEKKIGKKEKTHKLLIKTAVELFIKRRSSNVTLEEVADTADVARRTLYNHFHNKETLIIEIAAPIINDGMEYLEEISCKDVLYIEDITGLFLFLWKKYGLSLDLLYNIDFEDFHTFKDLHHKYLAKYLEVFNRLSDIPSDLNDNKRNIAAILFRCFVSILSRLENMDNTELRFKNCIHGIIEGISLSDNK
jgi:AcrR family transcriptional regulator